MMKKMKALFVEEQGQGMTEYGLVLGAVAVAVVIAVGVLGDELKGMFDNIVAKINGGTSL
jgi:pilus assembly protein Flp/PilA